MRRMSLSYDFNVNGLTLSLPNRLTPKVALDAVGWSNRVNLTLDTKLWSKRYRNGLVVTPRQLDVRLRIQKASKFP